MVRAILPSLPAAALVLAVRAAVPGERSLALALAELTLYAIATIAFTYLFERRLVLEMIGYLRRRSAQAAVE
jgi:hypothetical protein